MPICSPEVGIEFRRGEKKLVLYTIWDFGYFYDRFPKLSETFGFLATLDAKRLRLAQEWQRKYFPRPVHSPRPASGN